MATTGKDLRYPQDHPFYDAEVISEYSVDQAVEDGLIIRLGASGKLHCTTNFAFRVARATQPRKGPITESLDESLLRSAVSSIVSEYVSGAYCVPTRASDYPQEADAYLAYYLYDLTARGIAPKEPIDGHEEIRVWAVGPGDGSLTIMLPEDY
jgi:hypothetical protein